MNGICTGGRAGKKRRAANSANARDRSLKRVSRSSWKRFVNKHACSIKNFALAKFLIEHACLFTNLFQLLRETRFKLRSRAFAEFAALRFLPARPPVQMPFMIAF